MNECVKELRKDYFFLPQHTSIYGVLVMMWEKNDNIDLITLTQTLRDKNLLEAVGGPSYVTHLFSFVPSASNAAHYISIVKEKYLAREIRSICEAGLNGISRAEDPEAVISNIQNQLLATTQGQTIEKKTLKDYVHGAMTALEEAHARKGRIPGLSTGLVDLDKQLGGLISPQLIIICGVTGGGKAQPLDSDILTPAGFVKMGNIRLGEKIIGVDGKKYNVTGVFPQGVKNVTRVGFSDGSKVECCLEHLWETSTKRQRYTGKSRVWSTGDILADINNRHSVPFHSPVDFCPTETLTVNPYVLGCLLGDGSFVGTNIRFTSADADIIRKVNSLLPERDLISKKTYSDIDFVIKRKQRNNKKTTTKYAIEALGLGGLKSKDKFIPESYLLAKTEDRIELLRGLLDTDGWAIKNRSSVGFCSTSQRLCEDVTFLGRSLGCIIKSPKKFQPICYKEDSKINGAVAWKIVIRFPFKSFSPFHCARKSQSMGKGFYTNTRAITSIESIGGKECQCISTDAPRGLYITNDFVPTHNTALALKIASHNSIDFGIPTGFISLEMSGEELSERLIARVAKVDLHNLVTKGGSDRDLAKIPEAVEKISEAPLIICDDSDMESAKMRAIGREMKREHGIKLLVVDYIQLMHTPVKDENREQSIATAVASLKQMAKELDIVVIALSQLNDNGLLRESRAIGHHADKIIKIREDKANPGCVYFDVEKNRKGPKGTVSGVFIPAYTDFADRARSLDF